MEVKRRKVLVVDDDPQIYRIISRLLDSNRYEVSPAHDGHEALNKIQAYHPELLILDLMMPHLSGIDVCQRLKKKEETQDIMILVLSAKDGQNDRRKCLELGADDFITKPFHIASLARKIDYMFEKKRSNKAVSKLSQASSHF